MLKKNKFEQTFDAFGADSFYSNQDGNHSLPTTPKPIKTLKKNTKFDQTFDAFGADSFYQSEGIIEQDNDSKPPTPRTGLKILKKNH
jgi:hypothetical protein